MQESTPEPIDTMTKSEQNRRMDAALRQIQSALDAVYEVFAEGKPGIVHQRLMKLCTVTDDVRRNHQTAIGHEGIGLMIARHRPQQFPKVHLAATKVFGQNGLPCPLCGTTPRRVEELVWTSNDPPLRLTVCLTCQHCEAINA